MTTSEVLFAVVIPFAVVLIGATALLVAAFRKSKAWVVGVKIIGIGVFLPLILGGAGLFIRGTVLDPLGRVLSVGLMAVGLGLIVWTLRLHPDRDI